MQLYLLRGNYEREGVHFSKISVDDGDSRYATLTYACRLDVIASNMLRVHCGAVIVESFPFLARTFIHCVDLITALRSLVEAFT
jgi:hypothetical protein